MRAARNAREHAQALANAHVVPVAVCEECFHVHEEVAAPTVRPWSCTPRCRKCGGLLIFHDAYPNRTRERTEPCVAPTP